MNITLITMSIIFIIASVHALYRDRVIKFDKISKAAKYIFVFYLLFLTYSIAVGTTPLLGADTFFIFAFGIYVLMSGNILHHVTYIKKKEL